MDLLVLGEEVQFFFEGGHFLGEDGEDVSVVVVVVVSVDSKRWICSGQWGKVFAWLFWKVV